MRIKPSIYSYLDYRRYMRDMWTYLKAEHGYTTRSFAREAKIKSHAQFTLIVSGRREMTSIVIKKLIKAFSLRHREAEFFEALVRFAQAKTTLEQDQAYRKLLAFKQFAEGRTLSEESHAYCSNWYIVAIFEALGTPLCAAKPDQLAEILGISLGQVNQALETLKTLHLIKESSGGWSRLQSTFETPQENASTLIRSLHREMIGKALESVDRWGPEMRKLVSLTLPLDQEGLQKFSSRVFESLREISAELVNEQNPDGVFQVNLQLFPLVEIPPDFKRYQKPSA